jgi:hypothetical protein
MVLMMDFKIYNFYLLITILSYYFELHDLNYLILLNMKNNLIY